MNSALKKIFIITVFVFADIAIFALTVIAAYSLKGYSFEEKKITAEEAFTAESEITTDECTAYVNRAIDEKSSSPVVNRMRTKVKNIRKENNQ
ncbi:MAG: hypothetical protein Q4D26_04905 [Clostridia bacterium]|nr:hypothetical protein [Clostridia bacterium]